MESNRHYRDCSGYSKRYDKRSSSSEISKHRKNSKSKSNRHYVDYDRPSSPFDPYINPEVLNESPVNRQIERGSPNDLRDAHMFHISSKVDVNTSGEQYRKYHSYPSNTKNKDDGFYEEQLTKYKVDQVIRFAKESIPDVVPSSTRNCSDGSFSEHHDTKLNEFEREVSLGKRSRSPSFGKDNRFPKKKIYCGMSPEYDDVPSSSRQITISRTVVTKRDPAFSDSYEKRSRHHHSKHDDVHDYKNDIEIINKAPNQVKINANKDAYIQKEEKRRFDNELADWDKLESNLDKYVKSPKLRKKMSKATVNEQIATHSSSSNLALLKQMDNDRFNREGHKKHSIDHIDLTIGDLDQSSAYEYDAHGERNHGNEYKRHGAGRSDVNNHNFKYRAGVHSSDDVITTTDLTLEELELLQMLRKRRKMNDNSRNSHSKHSSLRKSGFDVDDYERQRRKYHIQDDAIEMYQMPSRRSFSRSISPNRALDFEQTEKYASRFHSFHQRQRGGVSDRCSTSYHASHLISKNEDGSDDFYSNENYKNDVYQKGRQRVTRSRSMSPLTSGQQNFLRNLSPSPSRVPEIPDRRVINCKRSSSRESNLQVDFLKDQQHATSGGTVYHHDQRIALSRRYARYSIVKYLIIPS